MRNFKFGIRNYFCSENLRRESYFRRRPIHRILRRTDTNIAGDGFLSQITVAIFWRVDLITKHPYFYLFIR